MCLFVSEPQREQTEDCLLPVSPLVEAEMMRINNVLSNFRENSCETSSLQTPQRLKTVQKRKSIFVTLLQNHFSDSVQTSTSKNSFDQLGCSYLDPSFTSLGS